MNSAYFWETFWSIAGALIVALLGWLVAKVRQWINAKMGDSKESKLMSQLLNIVYHSVTQVTQTYTSTMKASGKWNEETQKIAFDKCKELVETQLSDELRDFIKENYNDVTTFITSLIETTVFNNKK